MRNMLGGLLATLIGSLLLVYILDLSQPAYPQEVIAIWALLVGSHSLSHSFTVFFDPLMLASYLLVWLIMGLVIAPFSKSGWNAVRTAVNEEGMESANAWYQELIEDMDIEFPPDQCLVPGIDLEGILYPYPLSFSTGPHQEFSPSIRSNSMEK